MNNMDNKNRLFELMQKINPDFNVGNNQNIVRSTNSESEYIDTTKKYNNTISMKPNGLWYEINGSWVEWCKNEMPHWVKNYDIILDIDMSDILILDTYEKALNFNNNYEIKKEYLNYIDWGALSKNYKGIEIPDIYSLKYTDLDDTYWVSTWDVNSGCIWNLTAIKNFKSIDCRK